jgi:hypothetical protein
VLVPRAAVQFAGDEGHGTVMLVSGGKEPLIARQRAVETAGGSGDPVAITSGIAAGDVVVVEGGYGLPDGTQVRIDATAERSNATGPERK